MPTAQEIQLAIARNVRTFRTARGMSLDELATRSSVSRAMIVQIEQGRTNPSINTLCLLADALGEPMTSLLDLDDASPARIITAVDAVELWRGKRGSRARVLAGAGSSGPVELREWHLKHGDAYNAPAHAAATREMLFVIEGELLLTVGDHAYRVRVGETALFRANTIHRYAAAGRAGVHLVMVVLEPPRPTFEVNARPAATRRPARTGKRRTVK